jgi:hypothetical protein
MKIAALLLLCLLDKTAANAQTIHWDQATDWKLYKAGNGGSRRFNRDSIGFYQSVALDRDTMQRYLWDDSALAPEKTRGVLWEGDFWISCKYSDSLKVLRISHYAGFFEDIGTGVYYTVDRSVRRGWQNYFTRMFLPLTEPASK